MMTAMLRPATPADRPDLIQLVLAEDAAWSDGLEVSADEAAEVIDQHRPGMIFERDGHVAGYAAIGEGGGTIVLADPADPVPALEALAAWLAERGHRQIDAYAQDAPRIAWLQAHGFTHRRSSFDLQRDLEPPLPAPVMPNGIVIEDYRAGEDDAAIHELIYVDAAWGDVPGHADRSLDAWRSMITPGYLGWVARRDGRAVGWAAGRAFGDGRGWIGQLAVARSERGLGLGRGLLLHSLAELRSRGATSYALGVEAANDSALGLYRSLGFEVEREFRVYVA
jgi:ribosomal protein S18 acetylase RimI-like enzyme